MKRTLAAGLLAAAFAGMAFAAPARPKPELGEEGTERFLFFATLEGLFEDGLPDAAVTAVLEKDYRGRPRNFIYACPVCEPVQEGFQAYALRRQYVLLSKKGETWDAGPSAEVAPMVEGLASPEPKRRGAAMEALVKRWTARHMDRLRLRDDERTELRIRLEEGRKRGMEALRGSESFQHRSCPSCDGANGDEEPWR